MSGSFLSADGFINTSVPRCVGRMHPLLVLLDVVRGGGVAGQGQERSPVGAEYSSWGVDQKKRGRCWSGGISVLVDEAVTSCGSDYSKRSWSVWVSETASCLVRRHFSTRGLAPAIERLWSRSTGCLPGGSGQVSVEVLRHAGSSRPEQMRKDRGQRRSRPAACPLTC